MTAPTAAPSATGNLTQAFEDAKAALSEAWDLWANEKYGLSKIPREIRIVLIQMLGAIFLHTIVGTTIARAAGSQFSPVVAIYAFGVVAIVLFLGLARMGPIGDAIGAFFIMADSEYMEAQRFHLRKPTEKKVVWTMKYPAYAMPAVLAGSFYVVMLSISFMLMLLPTWVYSAWFVCIFLTSAIAWLVTGLLSRQSNPFLLYSIYQSWAFKLMGFLFIGAIAAGLLYGGYNHVKYNVGYQEHVAPAVSVAVESAEPGSDRHIRYPANVELLPAGLHVCYGEILNARAEGSYRWIQKVNNENAGGVEQVQDITADANGAFDDLHGHVHYAANLLHGDDLFRAPDANAGAPLLVIKGDHGEGQVIPLGDHWSKTSITSCGDVYVSLNVRRGHFAENRGELLISVFKTASRTDTKEFSA